jgi:CheY-like chemotaxis protein
MEQSAGPGSGPFILVLEDNERNARLVREILQTNGYRLTIARDGLEGLESARTLSPQLILMDMQLPSMDGVTLTQALKRDPATARIPIIAVTAHAMPEHRTRLLEAGCCSYISKPISYRPFLDEIRRVLADKPASPVEVTHAIS